MAKAVKTAEKKEGAVKIAPVMVAMEIPTLHMVNGDGTRPYETHRVDLTLGADERRALRDLYDGLNAAGVFAGRSASQGDALKWLLNQVAQKTAK